MNKLFTKIASLALGAAMAFGVGVAVASNKEATPVEASSSSSSAPTNATYSHVFSSGQLKVTSTGTATLSNITWNTTCANTSAYVGWDATKGIQLGSGTAGKTIQTGYTISTAVSNFGTNKKVTKMAVGMSNASKGGYSGTFPNSDTWSGTETSVTYYTSTAMSITSGNITFSFQSTAQKAVYIKAIYVWYESASTPLTSIGLSGTGVSSNAISIGSSDSTAHTINVSLTPSTATDQKVNIAHQSGTSGLFTKSASQITCSSGSGSFTITGTNATSGSETFRISGNTETSVWVDLVVTALNDSVTYYTVTYSTAVSSVSPTSEQVEANGHPSLPTPTALAHYTFNGWKLNDTLIDGTLVVTDDITLVADWTEDAKYTVTYVHGDHGTGNNYVVNNVYGGSYTLATFATAGFTASSGYSFKKWSVGGVEYAEGASITISGATTVTAVYQELTTYTIVTDASTLTDGTTFVLVGYISSTYYVSNGLNSGHVLLTSKTAATTISNGVESGSTLVSTEAQVLTLEGSTGAFKIKYGDAYLKFTGTSNGNDSFDTEANASTFSASMSGSYILFTCTSSTGSGRVWRLNTGSKDMRNYATNSGVGDVYMFASVPVVDDPCSVSYTGSHGSLSSTADVEKGDPLNVTLIPDTHYHLPTSITVTMDSDTLVETTDYTYNSGTGAISIAEVTGDVVISTSCIEDNKYTVTYTAGTNGSGSFSDTNIYVGTYTLLPFDQLTGVSADTDYRFKDYTVDEQTKSPGDEITISAATAVTVNFEEEPDETTITTSIGTYASTHSWANETQYESVIMDSNITVTASGSDNTGKYYSSNSSWRVYQNESPTIEVAASNGCLIQSIIITYSIKNTGVLLDASSNQVASGDTVNAGGVSTYSFGVGNTAQATNGQVQITSIEVTYTSGSSVSTYTVTYDANGGSGTMTDPDSPYNPGSLVTTLHNEFTYAGYTFVKWNTQADGNGTDYEENSTFTISGDTTLYAQWEQSGGGGSATAKRCYSLVTSTSDLVADAKYIIVGHTTSTPYSYYAMSTTQNTNNRGQEEVTVSGTVASVTSDAVEVVTLGGSAGAWTFAVTDGYLYAASSSKNYLRTQSTNDANGEWAISIGNDGVVTAEAQGSNSHNLLQYNSGSSLFSAYSNSQQNVYLYKLDFGETLLGNITCDGSGSHTLPTGWTWNTDLQGVYNDLPSSEQTALASASSAGLARYDYIVGKYNPTGSIDSTQTDYVHFITGRTVTPVSNSRILLGVIIGDNVNSVAIIVIISMVSVTAIGGYFFLRKRKENI